MRYRRSDQRGFSLTEIMVAAAILVIVTAGTSTVFISQYRAYESQKMITDTEQVGRIALTTMAKQIRLARAGADPAASLTAACACRIAFQSSHSGPGVRTFLTADAVAGATMLTVQSTTGFTNGTTIFLTNWSTWASRTIDTVTGATTLTLNAALDPPFTAGLPRGSGVFPVLTTTFQFNPTTGQLLRNTQVLAENVRAMSFQYFDGSNAPLPLVDDGTPCDTQCLTGTERATVNAGADSLACADTAGNESSNGGKVNPDLNHGRNVSKLEGARRRRCRVRMIQ